MRRLVFALIFVGLLIGLMSFIPDNPSTAYPMPTVTPRPTPVITPNPTPRSFTQTEGLSINYSNCDSTSIEWQYRHPQDLIDYFRIEFTSYNVGFSVEAPFYWSNADVEYWLAQYPRSWVAGNVWSVQGIGYYTGYPFDPHYFTDVVVLDCRNTVPKSLTHLPLVLIKR